MNPSLFYEIACEVEKDLNLKKEMADWDSTIAHGLDDSTWEDI